MNTFFLSLLLTLTISSTALAATAFQPSQKNRPTKLAHFEMGAFVAANGTKLRVNIDKQLGGQVYVQLLDLKGTVYVDQTINPIETTVRLSLDLTQLIDGDYVLKVSNGLEKMVREIKITTQKPTIATRSITVSQ